MCHNTVKPGFYLSSPPLNTSRCIVVTEGGTSNGNTSSHRGLASLRKVRVRDTARPPKIRPPTTLPGRKAGVASAVGVVKGVLGVEGVEGVAEVPVALPAIRRAAKGSREEKASVL